jgi:hypothetical protein
MSAGELAYLCLVVGAAVVFAVALAVTAARNP